MVLIIFMPEDSYPIIPFFLTVIFALIFIFGERHLPYKREWNGILVDTKADFIQSFFTLPIASKLAELALPVLVYYPVMYASENIGTIDIYEEYGFAAQVALALLVCEFFYYWFHRLTHVVPILWRFHAVHHGVKRVYWLNSGRFHFVEIFFGGLMFYIPLAFFQPYVEVTVMVISISAITGFLEHINIDFKAGWLNYIFNTAQHHRWHHSRIVKESNKNYGKALIVWDILFRTFYLPKDREVEQVGTVADDVPHDIIGQYKYPFTHKG
jgi:ornithine lipid hydroxylase